jgi:hypothetical protein
MDCTRIPKHVKLNSVGRSKLLRREQKMAEDLDDLIAFLMLLLDKGEIDDEEFLMLVVAAEEAAKFEDDQIPVPGEKFDIYEPPQPCVELFRFTREQIFELCDLLLIPGTIRTKNKHVATNREALCMVLRRLATPIRLSDMVPLFGRHRSELSEIINHTINLIWTRASIAPSPASTS